MFAIDDRMDFEMPDTRVSRRRSHPFFAALMFLAAYFTTITVQAQPQDVIALGENKSASVTGQVKEADENWVIVSSAGKDIKVVLNKVNLKAESDTVFQVGQTVSVDGRITGDDFGMPIMEATSIVATAPSAPDATGGVLANQ